MTASRRCSTALCRVAEEVFVALSTFAEHGAEPLRILRESGRGYSLNPLGRRLSGDEIVQFAGDASGVVAGIEPYTAQVFERLPRLRCISRAGAGLDNIDLEAAARFGVEVLNTPDVVTNAVAEHALAMAFDLMKHLSAHTCAMRQRKWVKRTGRMLSGRTVGIIGLGRIGRRSAEGFLALGASVVGHDPAADAVWAGARKVRLAALDATLAASEVLVLHLSGSVGDFVLGDREIALMPEGAVIINVARGRFVNETALHRALVSGRLGGAALDVYGHEPYSGPLCDLETIVLTPHVATLTKETRLAMEIEAVSNLLDFFQRESQEKGSRIQG